jgi:hypothetical protein
MELNLVKEEEMSDYLSGLYYDSSLKIRKGTFLNFRKRNVANISDEVLDCITTLFKKYSFLTEKQFIRILDDMKDEFSNNNYILEIYKNL